MKIEASLGHNSEDGWEIDYFVTETMPPPESSKVEGDNNGFPASPLYIERPAERDDDYRQETLRLIMESVEVHHVTWAKVSTKSYPVSRYRREECAPKY